jgi:hypothetical protein
MSSITARLKTSYEETVRLVLKRLDLVFQKVDAE